MVRPISMDLRERLILAVERDGMSARSAAVRFGVSASSAIKWLQRYRTRGSVAPDKIGGHKPRLLAGSLRDWLLERTQRDFTLRGLTAELGAEFGIKVDYVQVWRFVHEEGLSFKKNGTSRRAASSRRRLPTRAMEEISGPS